LASNIQTVVPQRKNKIKQNMTCQPSHASLDRQKIKETWDKIDSKKELAVNNGQWSSGLGNTK
jgi:hypothetical protein